MTVLPFFLFEPLLFNNHNHSLHKYNVLQFINCSLIHYVILIAVIWRKQGIHFYFHFIDEKAELVRWSDLHKVTQLDVGRIRTTTQVIFIHSYIHSAKQIHWIPTTEFSIGRESFLAMLTHSIPIEQLLRISPGLGDIISAFWRPHIPGEKTQIIRWWWWYNQNINTCFGSTEKKKREK